jgi:iron complex transport system permease protein
LGAVIGIIATLPWFATQALAFAGGLAAVALIFSIGHRLRTQEPVLALVLTGVVVGSLLGAGVSLAKFLADPFNKLPAITFWLMGSFANVTGRDAWFVTLAAGAAAIPLFLLRWRINLLALPDDEARALGLNVPRMRMWVVIAATLMTAASVAVCGIIGWVGLVVPHAVRLLIGGEFSRLLPLSMIAGGCFMLLIDTIARGATALEIPPGVLTALIGAPVFIALLATSTRRRA